MRILGHDRDPWLHELAEDDVVEPDDSNIALPTDASKSEDGTDRDEVLAR